MKNIFKILLLSTTLLFIITLLGDKSMKSSYAQSTQEQDTQEILKNYVNQKNEKKAVTEAQQKEVEQENLQKSEQIQNTLKNTYNIVRAIFIVNGITVFFLWIFLITGIAAMIKYLRTKSN